MIERRLLWRLGVLGGSVVALIALAAGLSQLRLLPGAPLPLLELWNTSGLSPLTLPMGDKAVGFLGMMIFWILLILFVIYLLSSPSFRKRVLRMLLLYLVASLLLFGIIRVGRMLGLLSSEGRLPTGPPVSPGAPPDAARLTNLLNQPPQWLVIVLSALVATLLVGLAWFVGIRARRPQQQIELLVQEAQMALEDLRAGGDIHDTVLRCYAEMSRVLNEQRHVQRRQGMTPREFELHLAALGMQDNHIHQLTQLFERVRYGSKNAGRHEEREALACLAAIVEAYG